MKMLCLSDWGKTQEPATLCEGIVVDKHSTATVQRKFIVLKDLEVLRDGSAPGHKLTMVIGPLLGSYYHKVIVRDSAVPQHSVEVVGGGYVLFTGMTTLAGKVMWTAKVHGSSGDYGVYTPHLLHEENRKVVAAALQMQTEFEWKENVSPK